MGKLTGTALRALKPGGDASCQVADGDGVLIEVKPAGKRTWRCRYRPNGKSEELVIGQYPESTFKDARDGLLCARSG
jgi:hypothetical protein